MQPSNASKPAPAAHAARLARRPSVARIVEATLQAWPQHAAFVERHLADRGDGELDQMDGLAGRLLTIIGSELDSVVEDYRWTCGKMLATEMHFRRTRETLNSSFSEAVASIYADAAETRRYMRGLMLSQILWRQQAGALLTFVDRFLPALPASMRYLEVGPGHGMWMAAAAAAHPGANLHGWDISAESLAQTRAALRAMNVDNPLSLSIRDVCTGEAPSPEFDAVVASQILEIVSSPERALASLAAGLRPGGRLFLNVPVRAAAPDHIRRWEDAEAILHLVKAAGLTILDSESIGARGSVIGATEGFSLVVIAGRMAYHDA